MTAKILTIFLLSLIPAVLHAQESYEAVKWDFGELQNSSVSRGEEKDLAVCEKAYDDYGKVKAGAERALERFTQNMDSSRAAEAGKIIKMSDRARTDIALMMEKMKAQTKKAAHADLEEAPDESTIIGKTRNEVTSLLGKPDRVNKSVNVGGGYEQWCYEPKSDKGDTSYIYFGDDGTAIKYQQ
ncbi:MAG: hypothetical protein WC515_06115 [Candidatus Omnitrophota bacterium]